MITAGFDHIAVAGIAAALPTERIKNSDCAGSFGKETVEKIIMSTGIQERYKSKKEQTAADLAFSAAEHLMREKNVDPASIGILVFCAAHVDYVTLATAFVLQKRLGLSQDCLVFDMNLSCSACVFGLYTVSALLNAGSAERALFLVGDVTTKSVSAEDTSSLLFGDAGAAILLEKTEANSSMQFGLKSDGSRFKSIIVPAGGFRNPDASREVVEWGDGNRRSDYNLYMNGTDVFSFTMTDVPALFREFMDHYNVSTDDVDALVMHQPNLFILKHLAKKIKVPMDKVPISLDRYGNTSGASIPVTLCDAYGDKSGETLKLMLSGFGVGLSWGVATLALDTDAVLPIIHTDDYYKDGYVSHE